MYTFSDIRALIFDFFSDFFKPDLQYTIVIVMFSNEILFSKRKSFWFRQRASRLRRKTWNRGHRATCAELVAQVLEFEVKQKVEE